MNSVKNHWGEGWTHYPLEEDKVGDVFPFKGNDWIVVKHLTLEEAVAFSAHLQTLSRNQVLPPTGVKTPISELGEEPLPECYWCEDTEGVTLVKSCQLYGCRECAEECGRG